MKLWKLAVLVALLGTLNPNWLVPCSCAAMLIAGYVALRALAARIPQRPQFRVWQLLVLVTVACACFAGWRISPENGGAIGAALVLGLLLCAWQIGLGIRDLRRAIQAP
jgi:hypothetical protein